MWKPSILHGEKTLSGSIVSSRLMNTDMSSLHASRIRNYSSAVHECVPAFTFNYDHVVIVHKYIIITIIIRNFRSLIKSIRLKTKENINFYWKYSTVFHSPWLQLPFCKIIDFILSIKFQKTFKRFYTLFFTRNIILNLIQ